MKFVEMTCPYLCVIGASAINLLAIVQMNRLYEAWSQNAPFSSAALKALAIMSLAIVATQLILIGAKILGMPMAGAISLTVAIVVIGSALTEARLEHRRVEPLEWTLAIALCVMAIAFQTVTSRAAEAAKHRSEIKLSAGDSERPLGATAGPSTRALYERRS